MTEELNNFNTDMKELFIQNKLEEILEQLETKTSEEIHDLVYVNFDVVKKYYDLEKFDLLFTHFRFVAYSCFLCEYATQRQVLTQEDATPMMAIFTSIHAMMQQGN